MNGTLGRDKVWNEHIWSEIDKAVREEVGRIRVAQKAFPSIIVNNVLPVSTVRAVPFGTLAPVFPVLDQFQPFFEISREFVLTQAQVDREENVHLAPSLARLAASVIAAAEDTILFLGPGGIPGGVNVTNQPPPLPPPGIPPQFAAIPPGFLAEANAYPAISVPGAVAGAALGNILAAVADGIVALNGRAQPGPYTLFLPPVRYGQTFQPPVGQLKSPGDQINHVVTGGCYMVSSLAVIQPARPAPPLPDNGILVSLGGEPVKIILGTEAMTAFTHTDSPGTYHFRVFEPIQVVVQDGRAFQRLAFG